uniref:ZP domain-containing protein n=1 Tax=Ascaris lumbricoides TaxID=6252 RepID=A0A0M3I6T6_ASCLU
MTRPYMSHPIQRYVNRITSIVYSLHGVNQLYLQGIDIPSKNCDGECGVNDPTVHVAPHPAICQSNHLDRIFTAWSERTNYIYKESISPAKIVTANVVCSIKMAAAKRDDSSMAMKKQWNVERHRADAFALPFSFT